MSAPAMTPEELANLPTIYRGSRGQVAITDLPWPHLNNAIAKLDREREAWATSAAARAAAQDGSNQVAYPREPEWLALHVELGRREAEQSATESGGQLVADNKFTERPVSENGRHTHSPPVAGDDATMAALRKLQGEG